MEQPLPKPQKAIVVSSPNSGRSAQLSQALTTLRSLNVEILETLSITALDGLPAQGNIWKEQGADLVVAAGGDGLVGGVIAHSITSDLPLGILPLGTANDVARSVAIPQDPVRAAEVIAFGKHIEVDMGIAQPAQQAPQRHATDTESHPIPPSQQMLFAHALTVGLNVEFARLATDGSVRQQYGSLTYPFAVLEAMRTYKAIEVELQFSGLVVRPTPGALPTIKQEPVTLSCRVAQATVVNAPIFWGPLEATVPGVSLNDRLLDIVVIEDAPMEQLMLRVARFFNRQAVRSPGSADWHAQYEPLLPAQLNDTMGIHHVKAQSVTISTKDAQQDVTLDGEVRGQTPVSAHVADRRVRLIIPRITLV